MEGASADIELTTTSGSSSPKGASKSPRSNENTAFFKNNFISNKVAKLLKERQQRSPLKEISEFTTPDVEFEIHYYSHDRIEHKDKPTVEDITANPPEWAQVAWINVDGINERILKKLAMEFQLHPLAVEDVVEILHRPKMEFFGNQLFLITSIISMGNVAGRSALVTEQVSFFLIGRTLITVQQGLPGDVWQEVRASMDDPDSLIRQFDTGFLFYALLAGIVDTCKPILDELDDVLEDLEVAMMEQPSHELNKRVYAVKRHQITLRSVLFPTRKLLQKLAPEDAAASAPPSLSASSEIHTSTMKLKKHHHHILSPVTLTYLRDLLGVLVHLCEQVEAHKEVLGSLGSLYADHQAQRQGTASFAIAIVSVFFLPLTFVAGVYGMNFNILMSYCAGVSKKIAQKIGVKTQERPLPKYTSHHSLIALENDTVEV